MLYLICDGYPIQNTERLSQDLSLAETEQTQRMAFKTDLG
jgi:hypothetical protein